MSQESHFRSLVEAAPDGIVISRNGVVLYVNAAAARLLGYDEAAQLVGEPMSIFLDAAGVQTMRARLEHMRATGEKLAPYEYAARRRDGSQVVAEIASMFIEHEGAPAVLAFARDVTERVQMREQLAHAERLAAIGVLAAGVAHEINNPLAFMTLAAEQIVAKLAGQEGAAETLASVRDILAGASRIARIVGELRVYARQDDDRAGPVDLAGVLDSAARIVAHEIKPRARLVTALDDVPEVLGTARRLEQVFVNLLLNAAYAIDERRSDGEIRLSARATERHVVIEVADNGAGIPEDVLARVFEPFFTTKPAGAGTGLGLSICRDIVTRLGGDLAATSSKERGTTFTVTLPRTPDATRARATTPPPRGDPPGARRRVLVIDDEPLIVALVTDTLGERHDVVGATDPQRGLERILTDTAFDVVLCDLMMPSMSGMDLHAHVARERPGLEGRIVFATGGPSTARAREFLAKIPNRRLMKPFSARQLEECIQAAAED